MKINLHRTKAIVMLLLFTLSIFSFAQDPMKVHIIDVGQGSAALVEFSCGVILVDVGGEKNGLFDSSTEINDYLNEFFARRTDLNNTIDLLVLSHPHIDHTRSVKDIGEHSKIFSVLTNGQESGSGRYGQIYIQKKIAEAEGTSTTDDDIGFWECRTSSIPNGGITNPFIDPINCTNGDPSIKVLWGFVPTDPGWGQSAYGDQNNHSVVFRIDYGQSSILFTGDLEEEAIEALLDKYHGSNILDTDVYVVGHHGSKNGSTAELINAITPEIAVISFGNPNRELSWTAWAYGHPNKFIVEMLEMGVSATRQPKEVWVADGAKNFNSTVMSKAIYGTGWDGDITLEGTFSGQWTVQGEDTNTALINVNTADLTTLESLPSVGSVRAKAIIDYRNANGNFSRVEDLDNVPGIGPATIARIRDFVTF
jgi:competence ComEA-like helix-hairpin-helix protein